MHGRKKNKYIAQCLVHTSKVTECLDTGGIKINNAPEELE